MKTEHKIAAAAVGFIGLIVTIFYIANQPKNDKSALPLDKNIAAGNSAKTVGDKSVSAAPTGGAKPNAPSIPAAKPSTPGTKVDSPLTGATPTKLEPSLPPVATPAPARRGPETTADAAGPTGEPTTTPPASPGPTAPSSTFTPGLPSGSATLDPKPATAPPSGAGTTPTGRESSSVTPTPGLPTGGGSEPPKPSDTTSTSGGRPTIFESEVEHGSTPGVADLTRRTSGRTPPNTPDRGSLSSPGESPLAPRSARDNKPSPSGPPATTTPPTAAGGSPSGEKYTIQPGDRLVAIAREKYGDERYVDLIKKANPGLNENRIFAGKTLVLPPKDATTPTKPATTDVANGSKPNSTELANGSKAPTGRNGDTTAAAGRPGAKPEPAARKTDAASAKPEPAAKDTTKPNGSDATSGSYSVRRGDTLRKIAKAKLGSEDRWEEIYKLNKDKLSKPDALEIGMALRLPAAEAKDRNGKK